MKLCIKKEVRVLTWQGWFVILLIFGILLILFVRNLDSLLSRNSPVDSKILVVEGWLPDYALQMALKEYMDGGYTKMFITGNAITNGKHLSKYTNAAEVAYDELLFFGMDSTAMICVPSPEVYRDRTYTAALELKRFIGKNHPEIRDFNLFTMGSHGARSWHLFRLAFKETKTQIGVISVEDKSFESRRWWTTSKGFRTVPMEAMGYFFVYLFFWP